MSTRKRKTLHLGRSYGNGISVRYLPANQAWAVMWHSQVLRVFNDYREADQYAADLVRKDR